MKSRNIFAEHNTTFMVKKKIINEYIQDYNY